MNFKSKSSLNTQKSRSITPLVKSQNQSVKRKESIIETSIQRNKSYNKENFKPNPGIRPKTPNISAKSWVVINNKNGEILIQKNSQQQRQIASLTKIMTFMTTLKICESLKIPIKTQLLVSKNAASQEGTSANLLHGTLLSIEDLLYGLMLPSGNDAAIVLAEGLGNYLKQRILSTGRPPTYSAVIPFIWQMQQLSLEMNLNSKWANPHGLSNQYNKSSAYDLAQLCKTAMEQDLFKNIVKTKEYKCWKNTNKLLFEGWDGIKTGVTPAAGPCLAATVNGIIIILLGCKSMEHRWEECREIYNQLYIQ